MFLLAFLGVTVLTAIVVLAANIGVFGEAVRTSDFAKWGIGAVIAEIVGATVAALKWSLSPFDIRVNLDFSPKDSLDVDLDVDKCTYEVREEGKIIEKGKIDLALAHGGWQCTLPSTVRPKHVVGLNLTERSGQKWEVRPFYPLAITQKANER
jgi:hypothetical protein